MHRSFFRSFLMASLMILLVSCGGSNDENKGGDRNGPTNVTINGKSPKDFYSQFYFTKNNQGYYRRLSTSLLWALRLTEDGSKRAMLSLLFHEDGRFSAKYEEIKILSGSGMGTSYQTEWDTVINGNWSIDNEGNLVLPGVGKARGFSFNDKPALGLVFEKDIHVSGVQAKSLTLEIAYGSSPDL